MAKPTLYRLYVHPTRKPAVVKEGRAWWGFLFGLFWMLWHRMWLYFVASVAGVFAFGWILEQFVTKQSDVNRTLAITCCVLVVQLGNQLRCHFLEKKGYFLENTVEAKSANEANAHFAPRTEQGMT